MLEMGVTNVYTPYLPYHLLADGITNVADEHDAHIVGVAEICHIYITLADFDHTPDIRILMKLEGILSKSVEDDVIIE